MRLALFRPPAGCETQIGRTGHPPGRAGPFGTSLPVRAACSPHYAAIRLCAKARSSMSPLYAAVQAQKRR